MSSSNKKPKCGQGAAYRATRGVYGAPNSLMIEIESRLSRTQNPLSGIRTKAYCALTEI
jgi:hypothetical protein